MTLDDPWSRAKTYCMDLPRRPAFAMSLMVLAFSIFILAVEVNDSKNLPRALVGDGVCLHAAIRTPSVMDCFVCGCGPGCSSGAWL